MLEVGNMGECEDPSDVDKGQTVMAGRPRQSVSKTAGLMEGVCVWGGSRDAAV